MDRRRLILSAAAWPFTAPARGEGAVLRVLAFGDSLIAGTGLPAGQGLVPALSRWLQARRAPPLRFRNAGLSGDTSYGGRVRIGWALRWRPDAVMVAIGGNDMLMGIGAERAERNLDAILGAAGAGGRPLLLLGVGAVGAPDFVAQWNAIWPALAARHHALLVPDLYAPIRGAAEDARRGLLQEDGLHPSEAGVAAMAGLVGPRLLALIRRAAPVAG